jgi:hypothetical protein
LDATKRKPADTAASYLLNKKPYLDYPTALARGWPIASGSASLGRRLADPEGDGSFEQVTLHPQAGVLPLQLGQPCPLVAGQPLLLTGYRRRCGPA